MPHKFIIYTILLIGVASIACNSSPRSSGDAGDDGGGAVNVAGGFQPIGSPFVLKITTRGEVSIQATTGILTPIGYFSLSANPLDLFNTKPAYAAEISEPSTLLPQEEVDDQKRAEDLSKVSVIKEIKKIQDKRVIIVRVDDNVTIFELEPGEKFSIKFESEDAPYKRVNFQEVGDKGDILIELETILINCLIPEACLNSPEPDSQVNGIVEIRGTATRFNFDYYKIEYIAEYSDKDWSYLLDSKEPVIDGVLFRWDTSQVPPGRYVVRLIVVDKSGNYWAEIPKLRLFIGQVPPIDTLSEKESTPEPITQGDLTIGESATVNNTGGKGLNCRIEPAREAKEVGQFSDGTVVTIIGGPIPQDGLNWWQVQKPDQTPCWVAGDWLFR